MSAPRTLFVSPERAGMRLDAFLADELRVSRAEARRLLERGAVAVDGLEVALHCGRLHDKIVSGTERVPREQFVAGASLVG